MMYNISCTLPLVVVPLGEAVNLFEGEAASPLFF